MPRFRTLSVLSLALGAACSGATTVPPDGHVPDAPDAPSQGADVLRSDGPAPDSAAEAGVDGGTDSGADGAIDSGTDSGADSGIDTGVDGGIHDATGDSGPPPDVGPTPDSGTDGGTPPDSGVALTDLSDEFNDPSTLSNWSILNVVEGLMPAYTTLDISTSSAGFLTIVPTESFWFDDAEGTFVFKQVTGDFIMHTSVKAVSTHDATMPPTMQYNGGGLMVRNPASHQGMMVQNWEILTVGFQDRYVGSEFASTTMSNTAVFLRPAPNDCELVICRIGMAYHVSSRCVGDTLWQDLDDGMRPDLPATLQVGMAAQAFGMPADVRLEWDWVRFALPMALSDCTMDIPPH